MPWVQGVPRLAARLSSFRFLYASGSSSSLSFRFPCDLDDGLVSRSLFLLPDVEAAATAGETAGNATGADGGGDGEKVKGMKDSVSGRTEGFAAILARGEREWGRDEARWGTG